MLTYNSILATIAAEGLIKSYVIPKTMKKYNLDEMGTFWLLLALLAIFSILEFFVLSHCINTDNVTNIFGDNDANRMGKVFLLLVVSLVVNYPWILSIYNKFDFWKTIGILSVV